MWIPVSKTEMPELLAAIKDKPGLANLQQTIEELVEENQDETTLKYRQAANAIHGCDEIEIDDDANISPNDEGGCWVQAWVYVLDEEAGVDSELDLINERGDDDW